MKQIRKSILVSLLLFALLLPQVLPVAVLADSTNLTTSIPTEVRLALEITGKGTVQIGSQKFSASGTCSVPRDGALTLSFSAGWGYRLQAVYLDGTDVTSQIRNNTLTLEAPRADAVLAVTWTNTLSSLRVEEFELTNNQSIKVLFNREPYRGAERSSYTVLDPSGAAVMVTYAGALGDGVYQLNFADPLKAGRYTLIFSGEDVPLSAPFDILLDLSVYRIVDRRHVIIQLSDAIIGCTTAGNYSFHTLSGTWINITQAESAFVELGGVAPNVFKLTTDRDLQENVTYVVETKNMSQNGLACQGTIAYFTPEAFPEAGAIEVTALTNNQSIIIKLPDGLTGFDKAENYLVRSSTGEIMPVGNVRSLGQNQVEVNFADPLKADSYTITTRGMNKVLTGSFEITLNLRIVRIEEKSVIIQLNEPIYGCTTASNYFVHKLGSSREITAVKAESVFAELGGELPNVFRITLPETIVPGQTYIIETRAMALDPKWEHPCQGTIGYFTK